MKDMMRLDRLRTAQQSVFEGSKKPFDFYDTDQPSLYCRVGKTKLTFYCYISRSSKQKLYSESAHDLTKIQLNHMRRRSRDISDQYENFEVEFYDTAKVKTYLDKVYSSITSKGVYGEINRFPGYILNRKINELYSHDIEKWKREKITEGKAQETLRKQYYALHGMLNYAKTHNHISQHHTSGVKFKIDKNSTIAKLYTSEQMIRVQKVLKHCRLRDQNLILFTVLSGARPSETLRIKVGDIDFEQGQILVRGPATKTHIPRYLQLPPKLLEILKNYISQDWEKNSGDWLFYNSRTDDRLKSFRSLWKKIVDYALIKGMRFYDFRHTYCSYLINHFPIHVVQKLMGHRQIETTAKYMHQFASQSRDASIKIEDILGFKDF